MTVGFSETFGFDLDNLENLLKIYNDHPGLNSKEIAELSGIGRRKVDGLNGWLKQIGFSELQNKKLSKLGTLIYSYDPYFRNIGTIALVHYKLCSNPETTIWYEIANVFFESTKKFQRSDLINFFERKGINGKHMNTDVGNFLEMYSGTNYRGLQKLGYIDVRDNYHYAWPVTRVPPEIIGYCLYDYIERFQPETTTSIRRLITESGRVGKIFKLNKIQIKKKLDALESQGEITNVKYADIDGISYVLQRKSIEILQSYYESI